jgi:RNA polymerase sigma-70 factor (sigma-E family)
MEVTGTAIASGAFPTTARGAVAALFSVHHRRLVGLASLLVDDREVAEEIVQDAFESLYRRWNGLRDPDSAVAYLDRTVVYGARSTLRRRYTIRRTDLPPSQDSPSAESRGIAQAEFDALSVAVRGLPQRQREVVVLRFYLDLTEEQAARLLGISLGSVKTHGHRAIATLKQRMEGWA